MKSFSQTDTTRTDTTVVVLPNYVAKQVIKDLLEGDRAKSRVVILNKLNEEYETTMSKQKVLLALKESKEAELNLLIMNKDREIEYQRTISSEYESKYGRQVRKTKFFKFTSGIGIAGAIAVALLLQQ